MAPPIAAATVVACVPGSVSPVEVIGSDSGGAPSHTSSQKNCYFNEDTFKLIECVKARPALWHRKHLRQRVQVAHRGWEEIRKEFKATEVTSLKVRWKTLRDSFRREVKRIEDGEITTPSWPLFDKMSFLIGHFRTRESYLKSGTSSPSLSKSNDRWKFSSSKSQTDEEPVHNNATSSMGESESEVLESFVVYDNPKVTTYETVIATNVERLDDTAGATTVESDPEDLTMMDAYETIPSEETGSNGGKRDANSSQDVIELPSHMFGEVTFKNKLRARIKTEPVEKAMEGGGGYGMEADSDYNFLMSLHPFMKQLAGKQNLSVRIKIQQVIAEAMDEN